ncbi:hypothetical protein V1512DRAFT_267129 [Lipomyces arxii]|uniref:uncharacterized protein n=1 Tax=Lipomyces arxii TaxID=56418 RepID=UPI0034CD08B2
MKKLLGISKSGRKSPTASESSGDFNPYTRYREREPEQSEDESTAVPARNPYAIGSTTFNSAPSSSQYNPYRGNFQSSAANARDNVYSQQASPYGQPQTGGDYASPYRTTHNPGTHSASQLSQEGSYDRPSPSPAPSYKSEPVPSYHSNDRSPYGSAGQTYSQASFDDGASTYAPSTYAGSMYSQPNNNYDDTSDTASVAERRQQLFGGLKSKLKSTAILKKQSSTYDPSIMETEEERGERYGETYDHYGGANGYSDASSMYGGEVGETDEAEDAEVDALKAQMKYIKKESLKSSQSARRYAEEAEASGLRTLQMLGEQGDKISEAESSAAVTENNIKLGEDYVNELKTLNRSMFAVHVSNPFNSRRRLQEREQKIKETFHNQQVDRENNRRLQYDTKQRVSAAMGNLPGDRRRQLTETELKYREQMAIQKADLAQQSKFQFEADDEDFEMERDVNSTLDDVSAAASRLNSMAKSVNYELTSQNQRVDRLNKKTQDVEINVHLNTTRLAKIR